MPWHHQSEEVEIRTGELLHFHNEISRLNMSSFIFCDSTVHVLCCNKHEVISNVVKIVIMKVDPAQICLKFLDLIRNNKEIKLIEHDKNCGKKQQYYLN